MPAYLSLFTAKIVAVQLVAALMAGPSSAHTPAASHSAVASHAGRHSPMPRWLLHLGLPGLFFVSIVDSSIIPLPLPGSTDILLLLLVAHRGSHPVWLALAAIAGSILGGYLTWSAGKKGGQAMLEKFAPKRLLAPLTRWVGERGIVTVAVSGLLPPPVPLMPLLLGAGALGVSRNKFLTAFSLARIARYGLIAWVGATYGRRVLRVWNHYLADWSSTILWTFLALLVSAMAYGFWKYQRMRKETPAAA